MFFKGFDLDVLLIAIAYICKGTALGNRVVSFRQFLSVSARLCRFVQDAPVCQCCVGGSFAVREWAFSVREWAFAAREWAFAAREWAFSVEGDVEVVGKPFHEVWRQHLHIVRQTEELQLLLVGTAPAHQRSHRYAGALGQL